MPTCVKILFYLAAELAFIVVGGAVGAWLPMRDVPADGGGPGDGIGLVLFGGLGMIVAGMVGVVTLIVFWSVLALRAEATKPVPTRPKQSSPAEGVWPPAPKK